MLREVGKSSVQYAEIAYRTLPVVGDIHLALADLGVNTNKLMVK